jgi:hypothetical protein
MKKTVFMVIVMVMVMAVTSSMAAWEFTQDIDPMTDETKSFAMGKTEDRKGIIAVRCMSNSLSIIYLSTGQYFSEDLGSIKARLDKNTVEQIGTYGHGTNMTQIRDDSEAKFLNMLKSGNKLIVKSYGYSDNSGEVRIFPLSGSTTAIEKVEAACQ